MARKGQKTKVGQDKSEIVRTIPKACADETAAVEFIEQMRWGDMPACPRCGDIDVYQMTNAETGQRSKRFLWRCRGCKRQFTVRIGTVLEDSRIPLRHWCYSFWAACSSKKGVSALQIKRQTGLTYKSALFLMHRIRWAMADDHANPPKLSGTVEVDETYVGGKPRNRRSTAQRTLDRLDGKPVEPWTKKTPVVAIVQRGGNIRPMVMADVTAENLRAAIRENIALGSRVITDDANPYKGLAHEGWDHESVTHSRREYVRASDPSVHTNTVEGFFSILKRGIMGVYHNASRRHLHRYLAEFEFRYNSRKIEDGARTALAIKKAVGKRLRYRQPA